MAAAITAIAGCAALRPAPPPLPGPPGCEALAAAIDAAVRTAGTGDAQAVRIAGTRWLRTDRFLASRAEAATSVQARHAWLERLRQTDADARRVEVGNLSDAARQALGGLAQDATPTGAGPVGGETGPIAAAVDHCGRAEAAAIAADEAAIARLRAAARVPDDYVGWQRALGLYPLAVLPFGAAVRREEAATHAAFARHAGRVAEAATVYAPASPEVSSGAAATEATWPGERDALDIPLLDPRSRAALLAAYAPLWALEGDSADDRFGALELDAADRARVDPSRPTVYARVAYTHWEGRVRVQLVYTAWFPRRAPARAFDLLAGHLDGVMLRLTLDEAGQLAMIDSIHACGCWHLFVPVGRWRLRPAPIAGDEWATVPARLDAAPPGARVRVRLAARTHAVEGIDTVVEGPAAAPRYRLAEDDALRSLPRPSGGTRSLFDRRGIVPGTERGERWLFWPMGIAEPGAMRQWGRHATAFVGRRHFDEADLLERRFVREQ